MRGLKDYDSLDSIGERGVFHGKLLQLFSAHMTFAEMAEQGLVGSEKADAIAGEMAQILNSPGAATWWTMVGPLYKTTYELIEALANCLDQPPYSMRTKFRCFLAPTGESYFPKPSLYDHRKTVRSWHRDLATTSRRSREW